MNFNWVKAKTIRSEAREILPITSLIEIRRGGDNIDVEVMKKICIPSDLKVSSDNAARQYFRESMFVKALDQLS